MRDHRALHVARMARRHGYRPSSSRPCLRSLAGRPCRATAGLDGPLCECETHGRLLDHARRWRDADGRAVLTAEPYAADGAALAALLADCRRLGLDVTLDGRSAWCPGHTVLLVITSAARRPSGPLAPLQLAGARLRKILLPLRGQKS